MATSDSLSKTYFQISDVAELLDVPATTLRFWEKEFPTLISPYRNSGGRRYYSPTDIENIRKIIYLLKERGLKLDAAKAELTHNRAGVEKRFEVIERLKQMREQVEQLLSALNSKRQ
ncbi:MAG: MerR family transcriptional regulator [Muribaculaceae bacterium]|nr:MerR family transcriptional regulator [Muribaculaceae bacterium]